jgi:hypothetical protein
MWVGIFIMALGSVAILTTVSKILADKRGPKFSSVKKNPFLNMLQKRTLSGNGMGNYHL